MVFSVLIANYNNSRFLAAALESVLAQTYSQWEVILVDDFSTDGFEKAIRPFEGDKRVRVFRNAKNHGCGYTKRKCVEFAQGEILGFLDADDALHPDALKIMVEEHLARPGCSMVHSTHYICDASMRVKRVADYPKALPPGVPYLLLGDGRIHAFASFKKKCYDQTDGINPANKKAVDQDLYYKLEETGDLFFVNTPLYYYRIHQGSISTMGKEWEAALWHYSIVENACLRRIRRLRMSDSAPKDWIKKYKTRYYKIRIFRTFRQRMWLQFAGSLMIFPFIGGFENLVSYFRKLPKGGFEMVKRSFVYDHEIK